MKSEISRHSDRVTDSAEQGMQPYNYVSMYIMMSYLNPEKLPQLDKSVFETILKVK